MDYETTNPVSAILSQTYRSSLHGETIAALVIAVSIGFITSVLFAFYMGKKKARQEARFQRLVAVGTSSSV